MSDVFGSLSKMTLGALVATLGALVVLALCCFAPAIAFADFHAGSPLVRDDGTVVAAENETYAADDPVMDVQEAALTHLGVDVSEHQGDINWGAVRSSNVKFAIVRCGYGSTRDDYKWIQNIRGCIANNIPFGVYLYSLAGSTSAAQSEANHVVRLLREAGLSQSSIQLPIYLDMEDASVANIGAANHKAVFEKFKSVMASNGYSKVGVYSGGYWWAHYLTQINLAAELRWVAAYNNVGPYYGNESISSKGCGVWQYSSTGRVSGINGNSDMNKARADWRFLESNGDVRNMLRLYNPYTGEHFYTSSAAECGNLEGLGWRYEGVGWAAPKTSGIPVYRLYNKYVPGGDHHYTTNSSEYKHLISVGWIGEGVGWYSAWVDQVPVYRLYNPYSVTSTHHYTTNESEKDKLVSLGWRYEGRCWYGIK